MNTKMSSENVFCQSSLEHTNSMTTLIFGETWHNTEINVIQAKEFFLICRGQRKPSVIHKGVKPLIIFLKVFY
jgi:hypothetical protein